MRQPRWRQAPSKYREQHGLAGKTVERNGIACHAGTNIPVLLTKAALNEGCGQRWLKACKALTEADLQAARRFATP